MYPPDWQQGSQVSFEPIDNPKTVIVEITVKDVMPNSTLENILRDEFSSIRSNPNINNITMSEPNKTKLKDGSEAYQYQFDYLSGLPFRQFDLVTVKDGIAYKLSYASQTEAFNRYLPIAKTMIGTFQPLGFTFD